MGGKSSLISVRVTPLDAEFIADLKINGAITPSDKIRALLKEAREKQGDIKELSSIIGVARKAVGPLFDRLKAKELEQQKYSEFLSCFNDWLADLFGYMTALEIESETRELNLVNVEQEFAQRFFRLCNTLVRMGITQKAPCYDPEIITKNLSSLIEIVNIIQEHKHQGLKS